MTYTELRKAYMKLKQDHADKVSELEQENQRLQKQLDECVQKGREMRIRLKQDYDEAEQDHIDAVNHLDQTIAALEAEIQSLVEENESLRERLG